MHILLVHQYFLTKDGSGGSRFNEMTRQWVDEGHKVTVLSGMIYHNSGKKYPEFKGKFFHDDYYYDNLRVIRCHDSEGGQKNFLLRLWVYLAFVFSACLAGVFKAREKYDVILVTSPPLSVALIALFLKWIKRVPYTFEIRDLWPESAIDTGVLKNKSIIRFAYWLEAKAYKNADLINVLTPAFRENLIAKGIPKEKIIFIPNAADFSISESVLNGFDSSKFRQKHGFEGRTVITYVGAHGVANHLIQVIEAAEILKKKGNEKILFLLIGDGMLKQELVEEATRRELNNVRFVPPVSKKDVFKYIAASDFGMSVLKKVDTFKTVYSNKTFDYMACKRPIFMLIDGVSRSLVEEADAGIYVEPENPKAFVDAILEFIELDKDRLKQMGENGDKYARINFDRYKLAKEYISQLARIVK